MTIQEVQPVEPTSGNDVGAAPLVAQAAPDRPPRPKPLQQFGGFALDLLLIFLVPIAVLVAFGVNQWVGPYSPDSDFYFGLSNFGPALVERLSDPGYYWTRIGIIGPLHTLISALGTDAGYLVWRCALLLLTALPVYLIVKPVLGRLAAGSGVLIALTNTVILVTIADVYPSSAAIAGFALLVGFGCLAVIAKTRRDMLFKAAIAGFAAGWLPATQIGTSVNMLAASAAVVLLLVVYRKQQAWLSVLVFAAAAACTFALFILWARSMFPGRNWFKTNYDAITSIPWDSFHESTLMWLWTDPNLLVVPLAALIGVYSSWRASTLRTAIRTSTVVLLFMAGASAVQQFVGGGQNLQLPYYYSQLWPAVVLVLGLVAVSFVRTRSQQVLLFALCVVALPLAGKSQWVFAWWMVGLALAACSLLFVVLAGETSQRRTGKVAGYVSVSLVVGSLVLIQILQNGLGPVEGLIIGRRSPAQAFQASQYEDYYKLASQVESWVVANTIPGEDVINWLQGPPAIWGGAFAAADRRVMLSLDPSNDAKWRGLVSARPDAIAYTAPTIQQSQNAIRLIPVGAPKVTVCQSFTEGEISAATCIADFEWPAKKRNR